MDELLAAYEQAHKLLDLLRQKEALRDQLDDAIALAEQLAENLHTDWDKIVESAIEEAMAEGRGENN